MSPTYLKNYLYNKKFLDQSMYIPNRLSDKLVSKYESMYGISKDLIGPRMTPKLQMINQLREDQEEDDQKM